MHIVEFIWCKGGKDGKLCCNTVLKYWLVLIFSLVYNMVAIIFLLPDCFLYCFSFCFCSVPSLPLPLSPRLWFSIALCMQNLNWKHTTQYNVSMNISYLHKLRESEQRLCSLDGFLYSCPVYSKFIVVAASANAMSDLQKIEKFNTPKKTIL